jgi:putative addiction module killer protein
LQLYLAKSVSSPWEITTHPAFQNLGVIANLLEANEITQPTLSRLWKNPLVLNRTNFAEYVRNVELTATKNIPQPQFEQPNVLSQPTSTEAVTQLDSRGEFLLALSTAIYGSPANVDGFRERGRILYSLYKRGMLDFDEALDAIREQKDLNVLVQAQRDLRKIQVDFPSLRSREFNGISDLHFKPDQDEMERYSIVGTEHKWYQDWFDVLSPAEQKLVSKRLSRAADGCFGDYTPLRADRRIFEMRFFLANGQRIYFTFPEKYVLRLLAAGPKDDQENCILLARTRLEDWNDFART